MKENLNKMCTLFLLASRIVAGGVTTQAIAKIEHELEQEGQNTAVITVLTEMSVLVKKDQPVLAQLLALPMFRSEAVDFKDASGKTIDSTYIAPESGVRLTAYKRKVEFFLNLPLIQEIMQAFDSDQVDMDVLAHFKGGFIAFLERHFNERSHPKTKEIITKFNMVLIRSKPGEKAIDRLRAWANYLEQEAPECFSKLINQISTLAPHVSQDPVYKITRLGRPLCNTLLFCSS